jgi:prolyl-tRNA editing enzyme YbaK/EbsC (Cys-tRNA(Pro) deacylase)
VRTLSLPATPAVRALKAAGVEFVPHVYDYVERGGTRHSAEALGVDEHRVVKTLVMEARGRDGGPATEGRPPAIGGGVRRTPTTQPQPLIILMHGDREVSTRALARQIGAREVAPASAAAVEKHTGYVPGGVSPFGTRRPLPVYVEASILALERFVLNGGRRGFLVEITPADLLRVLAPVRVEVAIDPRES